MFISPNWLKCSWPVNPSQKAHPFQRTFSGGKVGNFLGICKGGMGKPSGMAGLKPERWF